MSLLDSEQIDLWVVFYPDLQDQRQLDAYRSLLSEEERSQELRFYFSKDRHRYLVTRALVRTVLSKYAPIAPEEWVFTKNTYGRPLIANDHATAKRISFNISHTQGLIVLGVTSERALGVDTENVRARQAPVDIARRFFSEQEAAYLYALPIEQQSVCFYRYWTLKESYIKARGMGLSIPLDKFSFIFSENDGIRLSLDSQLNDEAARWQFWQLGLLEEYELAICVEHAGQALPQLNMKKIIPLHSEAVMECNVLRQTPLT